LGPCAFVALFHTGSTKPRGYDRSDSDLLHH
jgi:hypothetical protein